MEWGEEWWDPSRANCCLSLLYARHCP
jgi:hypothetical protein